MDRVTIYPGQIPLETDLLKTNRAMMIAVGKLASAILGTGPIIDGFDCNPTSPASLDVTVGAGEIYTLSAIDATDYSSLDADNRTIVKQGILLDETTLTITPPTTSGYSRKYLVQVGFDEVDAGSEVLPYYNSSKSCAGMERTQQHRRGTVHGAQLHCRGSAKSRGRRADRG